MVDQVLLENRKHNERRWNKASSSLRKCLSRRTNLCDELDAINKTLEVAPTGQTHLEMEQRLAAIHTSLTAIEQSIAKFKNLIEECRMLEEEARQMEEEEASQDQPGPGEEATDIEMVDKEELGDPESSGPQMEANTEDNPPPVSGGDAISPEEENILLVKYPHLKIPVPGARLPWSQEGWQSYSSHPQPALELRRERPHRSLPFSNEH